MSRWLRIAFSSDLKSLFGNVRYAKEDDRNGEDEENTAATRTKPTITL
jgi:hypothetical protein